MRGSPSADPARGVFETLLVLDGHPVELDAHVERISASLEALFGTRLPEGARDLMLERAARVRHGKLRLTVVPGARGQMRTAVTTTGVDPAEVFPPSDRGVALRSCVVEDGLGAHKWADRGLLERLEAECGPGEVPLLVDGEGRALEASRANVFAIRSGALLTPPTDGRIVPGIARMRTVELAREAGKDVREGPLSLDDLLAADEVFLTNSVRGVEPVRSIDARDVPGARGPFRHPETGTSGGSVGIARELRRRWQPAPRGEPAAAAGSALRAGRRAG